MRKIHYIAILLTVSLSLSVWAAVPTTLNDFTLPGSQPGQSGTFKLSADCNCHSGFSQLSEPEFNWRGSMMSQAMRDPLMLATMSIANQDAPESGDLCIRCHTPKGWLEGRSTPTDGSALIADDYDGINCHFCHKTLKPSPLGVNPYPGDADYTAGTYAADQTYLANLALIPAHDGNGAFVVDEIDIRRGPFPPDSINPPHDFYYSAFHKTSDMCGTCHDVSNPAFTRDANGKYVPNAFDAPAPDMDTYAMFPVERTYSEWKHSAYNTTDGVYAPQFGGNKDTVRTCQDCHMRDVTGKGAKGGTPTRDNLPKHDMTGGNTFIPTLVGQMFPADVDPVALDSGIARATYMLQNATSMGLSVDNPGDGNNLDVEITNETGHKLPSGYPEGRRIWINVKAYNTNNDLIYESGAYNNATGLLTHDADAKIYEIHPGISQTLSGVVGLPAEKSFHFVLNDTIYMDNRIPPRGFTNAAFDSIQSPPVGYTYADGQYWDNTVYDMPDAAAKAVVTLYYQTTSKEYIEFLRDENVTDNWGDSMYNMWAANGRSAPIVMNVDSITMTPVSANQPPILASIGAKSSGEQSLLSFSISATDGDGEAPILTTSTLPGTASFTDNHNGTGDFSWTPSYDDAGTYQVTFYATDSVYSADVDSEVVSITITDLNREPVLATIDPQATTENTLLSFGVSATDDDGPHPLLTTSTLPGTAAFTDNLDGTGSFSWTPTFDDSGTYLIMFYATDSVYAADIDSQQVTITVDNTNRPPTLASIGAKSTAEGTNLNFNTSGTDPDGPAPIMSAASLPTGASFTDNHNGSGTFDWTPTLTDAGTYQVMFYATDSVYAADVDSEEVTITVTNTNQPPVLATIDPQSTDENSPLSFGVSASDADGPAPILATSALPSGASFTDNHNGTGDFDWTPTFDDSGTYQVTFYATDSVISADVDSQLVTITVNNVNRAPALSSIGSQVIAENSNLTFPVDATDADGPAPVLMTSTLPGGALFTDNHDGTGSFNWTPTYDDSGSYQIMFYATDSVYAADIDSELVTITVTNTNRPPVLATVGDKAVSEETLLSFAVSATDADGYTPDLSTSTLPGGAAFTDNNNGTGSFSWTPTAGQNGTYDLTFYAHDNYLAVDSEEIVITVVAGNAPPILASIGNQSIAENSVLNLVLKGSDTNGDSLYFTSTTLPTNASLTNHDSDSATFSFAPDYDQANDYVITFTVHDGTLTDDETITITVINTNRLPALASIGAKNTSEDASLNFGISASDPDGTNPILTTSTLPSGASFTDHNDGTGTFDWTPTYDDAGTYQVMFYATDFEYSSDIDSELVEITVQNVNRAPLFDAAATQYGIAEQLLTFDISASDPDSDPLDLYDISLPAGASFVDNLDNTGTFTWTPSAIQTGPFVASFEVWDGELTDQIDVDINITAGGCCIGNRGNANNDPEDKINISDVTYLTAYLFGIPPGTAPACAEEGNANGDPEEKINISDVTYLTAYLFGIPPGSAPPACPLLIVR